MFTPKIIVVSHTKSNALDRMDLSHPYLKLIQAKEQYHFIILQDGTVEKGLDWNEASPLSYGEDQHIGIIYVGGYVGGTNCGDTRTPEQKEAMYELIGLLCVVFDLNYDDVYYPNELVPVRYDCLCKDHDGEQLRREIFEWSLKP